jgi:hypothetical protein
MQSELIFFRPNHLNLPLPSLTFSHLSPTHMWCHLNLLFPILTIFTPFPYHLHGYEKTILHVPLHVHVIIYFT